MAIYLMPRTCHLQLPAYVLFRIVGLYWDNGNPNGNYYLGSRVTIVEHQAKIENVIETGTLYVCIGIVLHGLI